MPRDATSKKLLLPVTGESGGQWRPLGDQDSEGWDEKAAAIRAAARVPGASTSTCSAVRAVAGSIEGGTASHVTRMFAVRGGRLLLPVRLPLATAPAAAAAPQDLRHVHAPRRR